MHVMLVGKYREVGKIYEGGSRKQEERRSLKNH